MSTPPSDAGELPEYAEEVMAVVSRIPAGKVLTYGDVAAAVGWGSARNVGAMMSRYGSSLPWWRVVRADGTMAEKLLVRAREHWAEEGIAHISSGVDLKQARTELPEFKEA